MFLYCSPHKWTMVCSPDRTKGLDEKHIFINDHELKLNLWNTDFFPSILRMVAVQTRL